MPNETNTPTETPNQSGSNSNYENFDTYEQNRRTALTNAADAEIEPLLTAAGYPKAVIDAKMLELNALKKLSDDQKKEYGEQYDETKKYDDLANSLHPTYLMHTKYGRLIFADDLVALKVLDLTGRRKSADAAYCNQALSFYENALSNTAYNTEVKKRGITDAQLTAGKTGYTNLKGLIPKKIKETGEAQAATKKRDAAWDIFEDWFAEFKKYAMLALSVKPQLREKMGWKETS